MTNPNEPTLTCSEVVERLAECAGTAQPLGGFPYVVFNRERATEILHSWRERRVQELEEALRAIKRELRAISRDGLLTKGDIQLLEAAESVAEDALANSEWREQIRKGAKHDPSS